MLGAILGGAVSMFDRSTRHQVMRKSNAMIEQVRLLFEKSGRPQTEASTTEREILIDL